MNSKTATLLSNLSSYVENQREAFDLPALSIAIWSDNQLYQAADGILNIATGVQATTDSIFQIGSISKIFTTCLIMQLVEQGRIDIERPVKYYLADFQLADQEAADNITVGQLLDHSSGISGDILSSTRYTEEPAIARFYDRSSLTPLLHLPGEGFSYSNAAFNIAGRLIEVVTGMSWFDMIETSIFAPLGMQRAAAHPSQTLRFRAAMGHLRKPGCIQNNWELAQHCYLPMGWAPAGATISMSAAELVRFGRAQFNCSKVESQESWLSEATLSFMQSSRIELPQSVNKFSTHWALGWQLIEKEGTPILSHSGSTWGQGAMLFVLPEHEIVIAVQQNASNSVSLDSIVINLVQEISGIDVSPEPVMKKAISVETLLPLEGCYKSLLADRKVFIQDNQLFMYSSPKLVGWSNDTWLLKPIAENRFAAFNQNGDRLGNVVFLNHDNHGVPQSLHSQLRLHHRESD